MKCRCGGNILTFNKRISQKSDRDDSITALALCDKCFPDLCKVYTMRDQLASCADKCKIKIIKDETKKKKKFIKVPNSFEEFIEKYR